MKKTTCILLIAILISLAAGLQSRQIDSISDAQKAIDSIRNTRYTPNPAAMNSLRMLDLTEYVEQYYWGNWENERKVAVEYDSLRRIDNLTTQLWEDDWTVSYLETASYSPNNKPFQVLANRWNGGQWLQDRIIQFNWDGEMLQSTLHQQYSGAELITVLSQELVYNTESQKLEHITSNINTDIREWITRVNFEWDTEGRMGSILVEMLGGEDDIWVPMYRTDISYHAQDQSNYLVYYDYLTSQFTFGDHAMNHISSVILVAEELNYWMSDEGEWVLEDKYVYSYDTEMRLEQIQVYYYESMDWSLGAQEDFVYDVSGKLIEWMDSQVWDAEVEPQFRRLYSYSEATSNDENTLAAGFTNMQVYPNPFNPQTTISFDLAETGRVQLDVFNLRGQIVRTLVNEVKGVGKHQIVWNGTDDGGRALSSGLFLVRLKAGQSSTVKKLILQK